MSTPAFFTVRASRVSPATRTAPLATGIFAKRLSTSRPLLAQEGQPGGDSGSRDQTTKRALLAGLTILTISTGVFLGSSKGTKQEALGVTPEAKTSKPHIAD